MKQVCLEAYAKINLTLDISGRREDGYHLLNSVMQSVSLADTLTLIQKPKGITITVDHTDLPTDDRNICYRAASAFQAYTQIQGGVEIIINKQIPLAAGLGGGSADAAAVLHGLNILFDAKLDLRQLQAIGLTLGADVPFCLQGGTCLVEGIGEKVTPLTPFPQSALVLVKPDANVSTAEVYGQLDLKSHGGKSTQKLIKLLGERQDTLQLAAVLENALESVTKTFVPEVNIWQERLMGHGAQGALMSGSGPTVFGLFATKDQAHSFLNTFQGQAQIYVVEPKNVGVREMNGGDQ